MENKSILSYMRFKDQVEGSTLFGNQYRELLDEETSTPINNPLIQELDDIYNSIVTKYHLTTFQKDVLMNFLKEFQYIKNQIDPNRLKDFNYFYNEEDEELLLYRESKKGLINIIIHDDESFAFSYVDNKNRSLDELVFYKKESIIDYQQVAFKFFV